MTDLAPSRNIAGNGLVKVAKPGRKVRYGSTVPESVLQDPALNAAISLLPENYNFEIHKCVWKVRSESIKTVALQFPEGLLMYACVITDIIARFGGAKVIVLGDVTYGACCVDDYTAQKLGAELLIHYGHSCLVPISTTRIKVLYVFVEIQFDTSHLVSVLTKHFEPGCRIALMGTIQFTNALHRAYQELSSNFPNMRIPQGKPLSPGETLGCTAPILLERDAIVFVADGRFHLEAAMIQNPTLPAYRYDPYSKILSSEGYDTVRLKADRWKHILKARDASTFGIILGTLGRQGSPAMFQHARRLLTKHGKRTVQFLMAEIVPQKLQLIKHVDAWVQIACPRLSMDWGSELPKPLLTAYELQVALGEVPWSEVYPMDYYSSSGGQWSNNVLAHEKDSSRL